MTCSGWDLDDIWTYKGRILPSRDAEDGLDVLSSHATTNPRDRESVNTRRRRFR